MVRISIEYTHQDIKEIIAHWIYAAYNMRVKANDVELTIDPESNPFRAHARYIRDVANVKDE